MNTNRKLGSLLLYFNVIFLSFLFLSGCTPPQEPQLRIGSNIWIGYEPLYLARKLGYYDNTKIKLVEMGSASDVMHAMRNGLLEGAALTLDETLTLIDDGIDLKVILVMDISNGADVVLAKPEIKSMGDLRGKSVAVEYSAVGAILLDAALQSSGLTASDIKIVACSANEHIECYKTADAVVTFDPVRTQLLNQGAHELFSSSQIQGQIVDVLVVTSKAIDTNPEALKQLITGYFNAREYIDMNSEVAAKLMAIRMKISAEEVLKSFEGIRLPVLEESWFLLSGEPEPLQLTVDMLSQLLLEKKLLKKPLPDKSLIDSRFLPARKID